MKDKFRENLFIALPAAVAAIAIFMAGNTATEAPAADSVEWLKELPYITIQVLVVSGLNVFVVLGIGMFSSAEYGLGN